MQKITPFLWFDDKAEEAANFYVSLFPDSRIMSTMPGPNGKVLAVTFQLAGQQLQALNGGPLFKLTPAFSLFIDCETQQEVDELWEKLSAGGQKQRCGWVTDRYGLSWQIIPTVLGKMLGDPDRVKANRVMQAMLQMDKIDIDGLRRAYAAASSRTETPATDNAAMFCHSSRSEESAVPWRRDKSRFLASLGMTTFPGGETKADSSLRSE